MIIIYIFTILIAVLICFIFINNCNCHYHFKREFSRNINTFFHIYLIVALVLFLLFLVVVRLSNFSNVVDISNILFGLAVVLITVATAFIFGDNHLCYKIKRGWVLLILMALVLGVYLCIAITVKELISSLLLIVAILLTCYYAHTIGEMIII